MNIMLNTIGKKIGEMRQSRFMRNTALTGISLGMYGLTKVGFNIVVLKAFDSELVGVYNLTISAALLVSILIYNLFCTSLTKFSGEALGKEDEREFRFVVNVNFWSLTVLSIIGALLFTIYAEWFARQMGGDPSLYKWGGWIIVLNSVYNYFKSFSYVIEKVLRYTVLEVISSVIFFVTLAACIISREKTLLLLPYVLQLGFFCVYSLIANWKYFASTEWIRSFKTYRAHLLKLTKYSLITGFGTSASMITGNLFTLILGRYTMPSVVGYYAVVNSTVDPLNYISRVLSMVSFPRISLLFGKRDFKTLSTFISRNFRRLLVLCLVLCVLMIIFSPLITTRLFKENIFENDWLLKLMIISRFILILAVFHIGVLSGTEYPSVPNITGPISIVICIPFIQLAYSAYGLIGLGLLMIVSALIRSIPSLTIGERVLRKYLHADGLHTTSLSN
jgi:O-antigen/teichoic acid export membrane protein